MIGEMVTNLGVIQKFPNDEHCSFQGGAGPSAYFHKF